MLAAFVISAFGFATLWLAKIRGRSVAGFVSSFLPVKLTWYLLVDVASTQLIISVLVPV
jgi:hypothetical protein